MKPSDFQKTIQCQFDCLLKKVTKGIVLNYQKGLSRRSKRESLFCELPELVIDKLGTWDEYGNVYIAVDMELKGRIREAIIKMIYEFEIEAS